MCPITASACRMCGIEQVAESEGKKTQRNRNENREIQEIKCTRCDMGNQRMTQTRFDSIELSRPAAQPFIFTPNGSITVQSEGAPFRRETPMVWIETPLHVRRIVAFKWWANSNATDSQRACAHTFPPSTKTNQYKWIVSGNTFLPLSKSEVFRFL